MALAITSGPGRYVEALAGAFCFPHNIATNKSPHQSPHVVMTPHHIDLYTVIEEKNERNQVEIHQYEEDVRDAE